MKIIVIPGNYNQGLTWADKDCRKRWNNGNTRVSLSDYIIVSSVTQLRGIRNPHGMFVGTWRERDDLKEIVTALFTQSDYVNEGLADIWFTLMG
jgi:hypothetical protein